MRQISVSLFLNWKGMIDLLSCLLILSIHALSPRALQNKRLAGTPLTAAVECFF